MKTFSELVRSLKPTSPGEKNNPLAPPQGEAIAGTAFNGRMCMYRAMSGVFNGRDEPMTILEAMRPLIEFFQVPYDEDVWGLVMAYVFGLTFYKGLGTRVEFDQAMAAANEEGTYFISIISAVHGTSGHAIWAEKKANKSVVFHDNEAPGDGNAGTSTIRQKFGANYRYMVFKKSAAAPATRVQLQTRIAYIPEKLLRLLIRIHNMYATVSFAENTPATISDKKATVHNKADQLSAFEGFKTKFASKADQDAQYSAMLHRELAASWNYERAN